DDRSLPARRPTLGLGRRQARDQMVFVALGHERWIGRPRSLLGARAHGEIDRLARQWRSFGNSWSVRCHRLPRANAAYTEYPTTRVRAFYSAPLRFFRSAPRTKVGGPTRFASPAAPWL